METTTQTKLSPQAILLLECKGYSFSSKKTGNTLDRWELFVMGYRSLSEIKRSGNISYKQEY